MRSGRRRTRRRRHGGLVASLLAVCALSAAGARAADLDGPGTTRVNDSRGHLVPIPGFIPHAPGAYIDDRIVRDLAWITSNFDVYVIEGYAGPLPSGEVVGCPNCHVESSEHKIGLAVDLIPLKYGLASGDYDFDVACDRSWRDVTRLARWAEPSQGHPVPPFRWVGYDGDANHGCGNHLHLSWTHDPRYRMYHPSRWVQEFRAPPVRVPFSSRRRGRL